MKEVFNKPANIATIAAPSTLAELALALASAPWTVVLFQEARREWVALDAPFRRMVVNKLLSIARGFWLSDGSCKNLAPSDKSLQCELWRCKFSKGGRIVFDVSPDHAPTGGAQSFQDVVRVWCISLSHDRYERAVESMERSILRGRTAQCAAARALEGIASRLTRAPPCIL